ncbi:MAG TPA: glycosyltransferase family 61 protein, partial [Candidatus Obscuribacterales bacterium]
PAPVARPGYKAIYLENQLERVTGVVTSFEKETERISGAWREYRPTMAYLLRNAYLADGFVYRGAMKAPLVPDKEKMIITGAFDTLDQAFLTSTYCGAIYFGHFVYDELPMTLLADGLADPIMIDRQPYFHEGEYRDLFNLYARPVQRAKIGELILSDDFPWNDHKVARIEQMRSRLQEKLGAANPVGVYYRRGRSGSSRFLENEPAVEDFLRSKGFVIVDPQTQSATEMLRQGIGAEIIVGIEGSQMAPGLFSVRRGGAFLALQPPNRFNNHAKDRTDALGMPYGFVVGLPSEAGFTIDLTELEQTLDLLYAQIRPAVV